MEWFDDVVGGVGDFLTGGSSGGGGFLGNLFSGQNITSLVGTLLTSSGQKDSLKLQEKQLETSQANTMEQLKYKYDREFELAKLKLSSGGSSSGINQRAQIAHENAIARYNGILDQMKNSVAARLRGGENITAAYKNMTDAAQAPLLKRSMF